MKLLNGQEKAKKSRYKTQTTVGNSVSVVVFVDDADNVRCAFYEHDP